MVLGLHALARWRGCGPCATGDATTRADERSPTFSGRLRARAAVRLSGWGQSHDLAGILARFIDSFSDAAALLVDRDGRYGRVTGAIIDELLVSQPPVLMPNALGQAQPRLAGGARLRRRPVPVRSGCCRCRACARGRAPAAVRFRNPRASSPAGRRRNRGRPGQACLPARGQARLTCARPPPRRCAAAPAPSAPFESYVRYRGAKPPHESTTVPTAPCPRSRSVTGRLGETGAGGSCRDCEGRRPSWTVADAALTGQRASWSYGRALQAMPSLLPSSPAKSP